MINLDEDRSVTVLPEVVVYKKPTFAIVEHFEPMQLYAAQVFALNTNFDGPPSESVEFATPEGGLYHSKNSLKIDALNL